MTQLARMNEAPTSLEETFRIGEVLAKSGFFEDSRQAAQAVTKIMAGQELGLSPIASMTGIHIIKGRVSVGANLIASVIKRSRPEYDYKVVELTDTVCSIDFYERDELAGNSTFTKEDAAKAQTQNMGKFARNMLFARAMSNGARWFTPAIFGGPVYTPEEMGATVNGEGEIITVVPVEQPRQIAPPAPNNDKLINRVMDLQNQLSPLDAEYEVIERADFDQYTRDQLVNYGTWLKDRIEDLQAVANEPPLDAPESEVFDEPTKERQVSDAEQQFFDRFGATIGTTWLSVQKFLGLIYPKPTDDYGWQEVTEAVNDRLELEAAKIEQAEG